jgi:hypothetical protein
MAFRSRGSSVCIVSDYGLDDRAIGIRSPAGAKDFSLTSVSRPALRTTQPPVQWVPTVLSRGKARPGRDADHSPHLMPRSRLSRSYTSLQAPPWRVAGLPCFIMAFTCVIKLKNGCLVSANKLINHSQLGCV